MWSTMRPSARNTTASAWAAEPVAEADGGDHLVEPRRVRLAAGEGEGERELSPAVSVGTRLKAWNTKPIRVRRCVEVDMPASSRRAAASSSSWGRLRSCSRADVPGARAYVQPGRTRPDS
jgi:hypothetical protein